ncbi:MAG TPA: TonB-dependent receptor [Prolixibacteraceae bacterium]|nr:TonB-dependent receptor [Prolixibacteraceae bacterium]
MLKKFLMLMLFVGILNYAFASHSVEGYVYDKETNEPLPGATIYIHELERGVVSNIEGMFVLSGIPEKSYRVEVSFLGYETRIVQKNAGEHMSVGLEPSLIQAPEVVVTASNFASQHENAVKIEAENLENIESSGIPSFAEALTSIPGVDVISKGNGIGKPVIRGLSNSNILFLNNGVKMENYQFSENHPYVIDETGIDRVEVIKGPASLLYGSDAIGGLINILPEHPAPVGTIKGDVAFAGHSVSNGGKINAGVKQSSGDISWGLRGSMKNHRDYIDGSGRVVPNSRFSQQTGRAFLGHNNHLGFFKLSYDYSHLKPGMTNEASESLVRENDYAPDVWYQDLSNHTILSKNTFYLDDYKINANLSWSKNHRVINTTEFNSVDMALTSWGVDLKTWLPSSDMNDIILGVQANLNNNKNYDGTVKVLPDYESKSVAFMGLYQHRFFDRLSLQAGARYDYRSLFIPHQEKAVHDHGEHEEETEEEHQEEILKQKYPFYNGSFSLGATYQINHNLLLRGNVATAFRPPNVAELTQDGVHGARYEIGDANLKSQRNYEVDLSAHYHSKSLSVDVAGFLNRVNNYIYLSPTNSFKDELPVYHYSQHNAVLFGGEFALKYQPLEWFELNSLASLVRGKLNEEQYLPFIPHDKVKGGVKFTHRKFGMLSRLFVAVNMEQAFKQKRPSQFETETSGWNLINASAGTAVMVAGNKINLTLNVRNLLNKNYIDHLSTLKNMGYYNPGRNISLHLKWML